MRYSFNARFSLSKLLVRWAALALGVMLATQWLKPGITCADNWVLLKVVILLSFFNAVLRPVLMLFTLPFIIVTMGLGVLVINALLFLWVGRLVDGFHVEGFWPALWGALIVSMTNVVLSSLLKDKPSNNARPPKAPPKPVDKVDVIDI